MINLFKNIPTTIMTLTKRISSHISGLPSTFLRSNQANNTEIVSLTMEEIEQLSKIDQYSSSIQYLKQNNLQQSLLHLQFSLSEAKNRFPWSINLQACMMNRMSILLKLMNKKTQFQRYLQELYFISLSAKGSRHLDTIKNLINYMICLTVFNPRKANAVLQYIKAQSDLPNYLLFFDGLNDIKNKNLFAQGLSKLSSLPDKYPYERIFKDNNIAFVRVYCLRQQFKNPLKYRAALKKQAEDILKSFLNTLIEAENNPQQLIEYSPEQVKAMDILQSQVKAYISGSKSQLPTDQISSKKILKNSNSHIITMNIASLLFQMGRKDECFYFIQLSLEKAISQNELERVGMALILLGRCYYLQGELKWENTYLDLLDHASTYPKSIIKQALSTYSHLLFQQGRMYEAENYLNQSHLIQVQSGFEGLILPSYDFSF